MKAVIYFSYSRTQSCKEIANSIEGDHYEINPNTVVKGLYFFNMIFMGFKTVLDRPIVLEEMDINFDKYDDIHLVFPVWAGRPAVFMKNWLQAHPFYNKNVYVHASSYSGDDQYIETILPYIDESNTIVEKNSYKVKK